MTLKEAQGADWASKVGPSAFQFFGFRNRPLIVGLSLNAVEQLKIEYTFEGEIKTDDHLIKPYAQFFLEMWQAHVAHTAGQEISRHVFSNWDRISQAPNAPKYCEIVQSLPAPRTLHQGTEPPITFDTIVWGIGTRYTAETIAPTTWVFGDKSAVMASALDDQGQPVHITLVVDQAGKLLGANVELH